MWGLKKRERSREDTREIHKRELGVDRWTPGYNKGPTQTAQKVLRIILNMSRISEDFNRIFVLLLKIFVMCVYGLF